MPAQSVLASQKIMAFAATAAPAKAKAFYRDALGLNLISEDGFALVFDAHGIMLRVTDRKSTRLNSSHIQKSRMPSSA